MSAKRQRDEPTLTLYSYWRSSSAWRVRIALGLKKLPYKYVAINLLKNEDSSPEYLAVNPSGQLPSLVVEEADGEKLVLSESLAILEYLEERFPGGEGTSLFPDTMERRAVARRLALHIAAGVQPLQNNVVLARIEKLALASGAPAADAAAAKTNWAKTQISEGLEIFVEMLERARKGGEPCCLGSNPTIVDCLLVPQLYNAERFGIKVETAFPLLHKIHQHLQTITAFADAIPEKMPDAPPPA